MPHFKFLYALSAAATALAMSSCGALWTSASVEVDPGYYGAGVYNDWQPSLVGAPLISPIYWGNQIYPGPSFLPAHRPTSAWRPGSWRPTGNIRPGITNPTPVQPPSNGVRPPYQGPSNSNPVVVPDYPININGSNPGPVIRPNTGRN